MLCIASFFVFALLGIFSATHRKLAGKAWYCLGKKLTFRPCDINFNEELKGKLLGKMIFTHPRLAKFLDRWIDWLALLFVILSLWSLFAVALAGLNLWVYDTCNPHEVESCSLGGEACGIGSGQLTFIDAVQTGDLGGWAWGHVSTFGETISRVPDRFTYWDTDNLVFEDTTYYQGYDANKPVMVEVIDPSCRFCAKQFRELKAHGKDDAYNIAYVLYPIPDVKNGGEKFPHSLQLAALIRALAAYSEGRNRQFDWDFLTVLFTQKTANGLYYGEEFVVASRVDADQLINEILEEIGLLPEERLDMVNRSLDAQWQQAVQERRDEVEATMRIRKIPTLFYEGKRFDRVVEF